jgi:hypothetical protein
VVVVVVVVVEYRNGMASRSLAGDLPEEWDLAIFM